MTPCDNTGSDLCAYEKLLQQARLGVGDKTSQDHSQRQEDKDNRFRHFFSFFQEPS